jgi:site-specific DNA recombinase
VGKPVGIYLRISDDREGRELGVERQEEDCRKLVLREGDTVADLYKDNDIGASTRSKKPRPDYKRLIADAKRGRIQKIVAYTSGRLTRRPREHEGQIELAERFGTEFQYVASPSFDLNTAAGRRIARILAANDAGEAEDISERVCREKLQALQRGEWIGGARPFGFQGAIRDSYGNVINREQVGIKIIDHEAAVIKDAVQRVISGESLYAICQQWTASGVPTPRGSKRWLPSTLKRILVRPRNVGLVEHRGVVLEDVKGIWPSIISEDEYDAVRAILLDEEGRSTYAGSRSLKWLGTNLYTCGVCDDLMRSAGISSQGSGGEKHAAYRCKHGLHLSVRAAPVDAIVNAYVCARLVKHGADLIEVPGGDAVDLRSRATSLRTRIRELEDMLGEGELTRAAFLRQRNKVVSKLDEVSADLASRATNSVLSGVADAPNPAEVFMNPAKTPISRRRAIVDALVTVTILPGKPGRKPKDQAGDYRDRVNIDRKEAA